KLGIRSPICCTSTTPYYNRANVAAISTYSSVWKLVPKQCHSPGRTGLIPNRINPGLPRNAWRGSHEVHLDACIFVSCPARGNSPCLAHRGKGRRKVEAPT